METTMSAPKLEVKKVRSFRGNEGLGFNAELWMDGRKVAFVIDDANGGCYMYEGLSKADHDSIAAYAASLPPFPCEFGDKKPIPQNIDSVVSELVSRFEEDKRISKWCKDTVVVRAKGDKPGSYRTFPGVLTPEKRAQILASYPGAEILNDRVGIFPTQAAVDAKETARLAKLCRAKTVIRLQDGSLRSFKQLPDDALRAHIAKKFPGVEIVNDTLSGRRPATPLLKTFTVTIKVAALRYERAFIVEATDAARAKTSALSEAFAGGLRLTGQLVEQEVLEGRGRKCACGARGMVVEGVPLPQCERCDGISTKAVEAAESAKVMTEIQLCPECPTGEQMERGAKCHRCGSPDRKPTTKKTRTKKSAAPAKPGLVRYSILDLEAIPANAQVVTWKSEGRRGPSFTCASGALSRLTTPRPVGAPLPEGITDNGWITRASAEKIAKALGAGFLEF